MGDSFYRIYRYLHAKPTYRWETGENGTAQPVSWTAERRELDVQSDGGGRFVLLEQFFPGWSATIDGQAVRTERWNGAFQAIVIPAGRHRVVFSFIPPRLQLGAGVSLIALALLLLLVRADSRRGRRNTHALLHVSSAS
jgi:uncharacterized membrane protein YfhO